MRDISMERVNETRKNILEIIESATLTHEQKLTCLANQADSLMEVLDLPEGLDELLNVPIDRKCICDLSEGHAPMRPRYIIPDYAKFLKEGSKFLQLDPPTDLYEALNSLMIFYKHVPSVTNYPVYVGQLDELLEPYIDTVDAAQAKKMLKLFLTQMDRTILDSFSHANIGPRETKAGRLLLEAEKELENAVPNLSFKYDEDITPDDFALKAIDCAMHSAKPSFANHKMFKSELGENYVIASCYNGLLLGGGAYTLCRLVLGNIAKRAKNIQDFKERELPYVLDIMARYMDARIKFEVEESGFFENNFLAKEGFIHRDRFSGMYGLVGLADCVNILFEKEGIKGRFGHDENANNLGVEIMEIITADGNLLARLFDNLINNAIKYGAEGKRVTVKVTAEADTVQVSVANYGYVIPAEELPLIFDKFYRVEQSRSTHTGGTGLGLAIVKNIVDMHGGTITVKSDLNGTVFTVTLQVNFDVEKEHFGER